MKDTITSIFVVLVLVFGNAQGVEASGYVAGYLNGVLGMPTCDWAPYMYCT